jgi:TPR repeat protein
MSRKLLSAFGGGLAAVLLFVGGARAEEGGLGPADAEKTLHSLRLVCALRALCPIADGTIDSLRGAIAGQRGSQFLFGLKLLKGDGVSSDRKAGLEWIVKAAEVGLPAAARYVEHELQDGANIDVDETKVATALKKQADAGDVESMQVLAPMLIRGRGAAQDPQAGIALLLKAAEKKADGDVEYQIGDLYLTGTNGLTKNHEEAMKWYAVSASRGNAHAMSTLGGLWENEPWVDMAQVLKTGRLPEKTFERDIMQSYCWRMRAALMDYPIAHYELALVLSRHNSDNHGHELDPDLIQADFWFRLGARNREYDNSQVRASIEPKLTTAQLDQVKKLVTEWHKLDFEQMKATAITFPGTDKAACPPIP